jgi:hypothetical protein
MLAIASYLRVRPATTRHLALATVLLAAALGSGHSLGEEGGKPPPESGQTTTQQGSGSETPPVKRTRTIKVPDQTCGSGQRRTIETYENDVLVSSQPDRCVP